MNFDLKFWFPMEVKICLIDGKPILNTYLKSVVGIYAQLDMGEEPGQAYVMDLFWDEKTLRWKDNRRLDVYNTYKVYGYNDETHLNDKRIYKDNVCFRDDVVAFKKLPKIYK